MLSAYRGRIAAMILIGCATLVAPSVSADSSMESSTSDLSSFLSPVTSQDLLEGSGYSPAIDVDWMLRDVRASVSEDVPVEPPFAEGTRPNLLASGSRPVLRIDPPPTFEQRTAVNDMLVPIPVLSVGWSVVLSAVLFNIGAKVLRVRRRIRA